MVLDPYHGIDFDKSTEIALGDLSDALNFCLGYWTDIKGERTFPSWSHVDLSCMPSKILPLITVADVTWQNADIPGGDDMIYRFWGTGHVRAKNVERTGKTIASHAQRKPVVVAEYQRVIRERRPIAFMKNIRVENPDRAVLQTTLRLPLSRDGERVDCVMSASEWAAIDFRF